MIPTKKEIFINEYMKDILETHPVANLKAILRKMKQEVGSYSKMKKAELINRIMELKSKGFPVPKVEKYVKPERKKSEPKKSEPKKPEPKPNKFSGMTEEQNIQYIKKILRKKPKNSDTKAIKEFLEAHKDFFNELDKTKFFNGYSNKDKFKFLRLYINKTIPQLREELAYRGTMMSETKGMNKALLINFLV